jgi:uncharacterized membrane protein YfcA
VSNRRSGLGRTSSTQEAGAGRSPLAASLSSGRKGLVAVLGLFAGMVSGITGVGGGVVVVPVLVLAGGMAQHAAHGTSLAAMLLTATPAAARYAAGGQVDFAAAASMAVGGVVGARIGTGIACRLKGGLLGRLFAVVLLGAAANLFYKAVAGTGYAASGVVLSRAAAVGVELGLGLAGGTLAGCFGIGGGVIIVPAMAIFLGFPQKLAQGVSLCAIVPIAISGALAHRKREHVDLPMAATVGSGSLLGGLAGSQVAVAWASESLLKFIFALLLVAVSLVMLGRRVPAPACE